MANKILKLAALAGLGYAGFSALSSSEKTETTKALGFNSVPQNETDFVALIKSTIKADKELQRLLTGPTGSVGATGATGATGETGLSGNQMQNYGGSLLVNGALEFGNTTNFSSGVIEGFLNDFPVLKLSNNNTTHDQKILVEKDCLYKISFYAETQGGTGSSGVFINCFDRNDVFLPKPMVNLFPTNNTFSGIFSKKTCFFGGVNDSISSCFPVNTVFAQVLFGKSSEHSNLYVNSFILTKVPIGEPVPHNLPFLPLNQTVLNNTTGKVGIFNGSTVDYYF